MDAELDRLLYLRRQLRDVFVLEQHLVADLEPELRVALLTRPDLGALGVTARRVVAAVDLVDQRLLACTVGSIVELLAPLGGTGDAAILGDVDALRFVHAAAVPAEQYDVDVECVRALVGRIGIIHVLPRDAGDYATEYLSHRVDLVFLQGHRLRHVDLVRDERPLLFGLVLALDWLVLPAGLYWR